MENSSSLGLFINAPFYSAHFMELALWEPYVHQVCKRHGFGGKRIFPGLPGTFPTFIVESDAEDVRHYSASVVVKFFGPLYDGADSFHVEQSMGYFLAQRSLPVYSPVIIASGQLTPDWWYLIFEHIPGVSIGQVRQQLSADAWVGVAQQMGIFMKKLHTATAMTLSVLLQPTSAVGWEGYVDFLEEQRDHCYANHLGWNDLLPHLLEQVTDFILPADQLLDLSSLPHLIHADLTSDHLIGRLASTPETSPKVPQSPPTNTMDWHTLAIIDWGDTRIGNILYELVALHLDLFHVDKRLLRICLDAYGLPDFYWQDFTRKALSMVLLHQFPMPASVYSPHRDAHTLQELAECLFGI